MKLWLLVLNLLVFYMEKLLQIWTISGTSFLLRNTWRTANFRLLKIVRCIMSKEPTINASFGNMPEARGFYYHHQMETDGSRMRWDIFQNWWRKIQLQKVFWNWLCAGIRRDATRDVLAGELDYPERPLALVKMNAATSKKMTKTMNFNPLYQFELWCYSRVQ